jgi:ethanolamine permease
LARAGFLPRFLAGIHSRLRTPHRAILVGGAVGIAAIYSDRLFSIAGQPLTASIVTMSVLGAIIMYIMSLLSLFRLRRREPQLQRPYRTPMFPLFPLVALIIATVSLIAIVYFNSEVSGAFALLGLLGAAIVGRRAGGRRLAEDDPMLRAPEQT